jgi:hypothetical protein
MKASGSQLQQITALLESGAIRPVVDKVFPFESTNEALAYVKSGQTNDKVVIKIRRAIAPCIWIQHVRRLAFPQVHRRYLNTPKQCCSLFGQPNRL